MGDCLGIPDTVMLIFIFGVALYGRVDEVCDSHTTLNPLVFISLRSPMKTDGYLVVTLPSLLFNFYS